MTKRRAFILGAGVSGLVTGWKLLEKGWDVEIIEKEPFYGGMSRTWRWGDFLIDVGPHIYHTPNKQLASFWEKEFGDLFVKNEFFCKNVKGEKFEDYYDYPISYEAITQFPAHLKAKIFDELEQVSVADRNRAKNYKEYVTALVGPTLQEMFFEKYPQKIWNMTTSEMTATWAPKRIDLRQKITPFYYGEWNAVGKYGTGCVYKRIYERILELGGKVRLDQGLKNFRYEKDRLTDLVLDRDEVLKLNAEDVVISTIPLSLTARLLGIPSSLKFRGVTSVYLALNQDIFLTDPKVYWLYFDSPDIIFNRLSEQKKFSKDTAVPGKTCVTLEITYSRGDKIDQMSPEELIERATSDLCKTGLIKSRDVIDACINRQPNVYPVLHRDYQHELARIKNKLGEFRQFYFIGTTGEFSYADSQILFLKAFDLVDVLTGEFSEFSQVKRKESVVRLNTVVSLGDKKVGAEEKPYIIAEAGLNHNGNIEMALELIDKASEAGCDAVKFQTYKSTSRISGKVKTNRYADTILGQEETLMEMFERLEISYEDHKKLFHHAQEKGIAIFSTPFDFESVDFLESLNVPFYKIASFDLVNLPLIRKVARTKKPVIISTGMATMGQIEEALEAVKSEGNPNVILLHCISAYPASPEDMNLRAIETMKRVFGVPVGLSDHTLGIMTSLVAIGVGADVIERHFTLSRSLEGPDHVLSSEPDEIRQLCRCAGVSTRMLGDGKKKIEACEYTAVNMQRKSLYANVDIRSGTVITPEMLAIKGPAGGLQPSYFDVVVGRTAKKDIEADLPITWESI